MSSPVSRADEDQHTPTPIDRAVVITVDGWNVNSLGCYGNEWVRTPALDRLASEAVTFDWHYADNPNPAAARACWQTGRYQLPQPSSESPPDEIDCWNLLSEAGIHVARIHASDPAVGLDDHVETALGELGAHERWLLWIDTDRLLPPWEVDEELFQRYLELPEEEEEDVFAWPEPPVGPIDKDDLVAWDRLHASFATAVTFLDAELEAVFDFLKHHRLYEDVLCVISASGGYPLGEHGFIGPDRPWVHDEAVHIPLLMRLPRASQAGRRVSGLTQSIDLMPTLLDAFGRSIPTECHGQSLLPLARGEADSIREYACFGQKGEDRLEWGVRLPEWSFLLPVKTSPDDPARNPQLFEKPDDRWEVNDIAQHHIDWTEQLERWLRDFVPGTRQPGSLNVSPPPHFE